MVFIVDLDQGWKQNKSLLTIETFLLALCSLQLCLCLFCNQTRRFIYRSGEALYGECAYKEEEAVYVINIHGKTVQWESCSIIMVLVTVGSNVKPSLNKDVIINIQVNAHFLPE